MAQDKFIATGVPDVDALTVQNSKMGQTYVATVDIKGASGPVVRKVAHRLGRVPEYWNALRAEPADGNGQGVSEAQNGAWDVNGVALLFSGNGHWEISFS